MVTVAGDTLPAGNNSERTTIVILIVSFVQVANILKVAISSEQRHCNNDAT